jgi:hypothetical protein
MATIHDYAHHCGWPNCGRMVPLDRWGCREHWHLLPNHIRAWIGRAYRAGFQTGRHPSPSYLDAHRAALDWIREQAQEPHE